MFEAVLWLAVKVATAYQEQKASVERVTQYCLAHAAGIQHPETFCRCVAIKVQAADNSGALKREGGVTIGHQANDACSAELRK